MRRARWLERLSGRVDQTKVTALLGPRQCGKTTLARALAKRWSRTGQPTHFFDLEDPRDLARLTSPILALGELRGLVVLDEIQLRPDLFSALRVLVDRPTSARFLVLGSASGDLLRQSAESLTGRITYLELSPFSLGEVENEARLWLRGGFPRAYLPGSSVAAFRWLDDYVTTFLERDLPALGLRVPAPTMRRTWAMLAHLHGQIFNASELGRSLGVSDKSVRHYVDVLEQAFMVRQLQPWHENVAKRQVKAPKIYVRDSGLLHAMLGLETRQALHRHPKVGASFEGFALETVLRSLSVRSGEAFFWATHGGAELDLLVVRKGKRLGFEFKRSDHPTTTKSMHTALEDLRLERLTVVVPGRASYPLTERIDVRGLANVVDGSAGAKS